MRDQSSIPYNGHLLLAVTRWRLHVHQQAVLVEMARETDQPITAAGATAAGDTLRLRGVPCVGRGISGAIRGSRSDDAINRLDRELRHLVILAWDVDGTSPGTQPEEALFGAAP